jgi:hypothetical protein
MIQIMHKTKKGAQKPLFLLKIIFDFYFITSTFLDTAPSSVLINTV